MTPYVPRPQRGSAVKNGFFRKDEFRYDAERGRLYLSGRAGSGDAIHESKLRDLKKDRLRQSRGLPRLRDAPALHARSSRKVSRLENEAVLDRMAARLKARPEILDRRREIVEHPFGTIKQWMNQGAFLMRASKRCAPSSA